MTSPSSVQSIALRFTKGNPPTQLSHTQIIPLESMQVGTNAINSVKIDPTFIAAFNAESAGTIFTPSIVINHGNNITTATSPAPSVPNFVPRKITPTLSLASSTLDKLTTDSPFSLSAIITTDSPGVLSYSSGNTNVAEVNSSGQVTIKGVVGNATISVTQAASNDGRYTASSVLSTQLVVSAPPIPPISLAANGVTIQYTPAVGYSPPSFPFFVQANPRGTGTELFAVINQAAKSAITSYAKNEQTGRSYFTQQGQSAPVPFNNIVTTNMTDMSYMFLSATTFNQPIGSWDTSKVTNMEGVFYNAKEFNQPIGSWDTSNVTSMNSMFNLANVFNQPIGSWNTSNVIDMGSMFEMANIFNQPIGLWNTSKVTNMNNMFMYAYAFNQPIGDWNTSKVTNMGAMFMNASVFNQPIVNWNTLNVTQMIFMFFNAEAFNQNISSWQVYKLGTHPNKPINFDTNSALLANPSYLPNWAMPAPQP